MAFQTTIRAAGSLEAGHQFGELLEPNGMLLQGGVPLSARLNSKSASLPGCVTRGPCLPKHSTNVQGLAQHAPNYT